MSDLSTILRALEVVYSPSASNEERRSATHFLEENKSEPDAPATGNTLACDRQQTPVVRHYGLLLLENYIRYTWDNCSDDQNFVVQQWVVELGKGITNEDPPFVRNKIAQLWTEMAERSWGLSWLGFDESLCRLWQGPTVKKELVMHILETLSDQVFSKEEAATGLRGAELGRMCIEIFTPSQIMVEVLEKSTNQEFRCEDEGWLTRLLRLLRECLGAGPEYQEEARDCATKVLAVLRSAIPWAILRSLSKSDIVELLCQCFLVQDLQIQLITAEVTYAIFHRKNFEVEDVENLVCPLLSTSGNGIWRQLYQSLSVDVNEFDENKYLTVKKLVEFLFELGSFIVDVDWLLKSPDCDIAGFIDLIAHTLQHPSLEVSLPSLILWTRLLNVESICQSQILSSSLGMLLEVCSQRLLRFEMLPADTTNATYLFLVEEYDTIADRNVCASTYRRYCVTVIDRVTRRYPFEAMAHILTNSDNIIRELHQQDQDFNVEGFKSDTFSTLAIDAQARVVTVALHSFAKRKSAEGFHDEEQSRQWRDLRGKLETWCLEILSVEFQHPVIQKRIIDLVVDVSAILSGESEVGIKICEKVLSIREDQVDGPTAYEEASKELRAHKPKALQKLAQHYANRLLPVFTHLESNVSQHLENIYVDERTKFDYKTFLSTIIRQATSISDDERLARLQQTIIPVIDSWNQPELETLLRDFDSFCQSLNLAEGPNYFVSRGAHKIDDWSSVSLDEQGAFLRDQIQQSLQRFPLQETRALLIASTDQMTIGMEASSLTQKLWRDQIPVVLPKVLRIIELTHMFNNPNTWSNASPEIQNIHSKIMRDRVWQSGVSSESRDDFYARVRKSKNTLEGLGSAIRGTVRSLRDLSMWILDIFTHFGDAMYGHTDLPEPLAKALFADVHGLSTHQLKVLTTISFAIVYGCPPHWRQQFLPSILIFLFKQIDAKVTSEWESHESRNNTVVDSGHLDEEMKAETVLRSRTREAATLIHNLVTTSHRHNYYISQGTPDSISQKPSIRSLIITSTEILEPIVLFCTHMLRIHDRHSCELITRVLRSLIPEFRHSEELNASPTSLTVRPETSAQVREYFSTDVLKACISSLHEPYFAELQKTLAAVIASILHSYLPKTDTPREVILSLPGMSKEKMDSHLEQIQRATSERQQVSWVLSLLESVRGVSISEQGKVNKPGMKSRSALKEQFMSVEEGATGIVRGGSPELSGVADLFG